MKLITVLAFEDELEKIADSAAGSGWNLQELPEAGRMAAMDSWLARNKSRKDAASAPQRSGTKVMRPPTPAPTQAEAANTMVRPAVRRRPAPIPHTPPPAAATHIPGGPHVSPAAMQRSGSFLSRRPGLAMGAVGAAGLLGGAGLMAMAHRRRQEA